MDTLDRHRRRDPGQGPLGRNQRQETRREQLKVTETESPDTRWLRRPQLAIYAQGDSAGSERTLQTSPRAYATRHLSPLLGTLFCRDPFAAQRHEGGATS